MTYVTIAKIGRDTLCIYEGDNKEAARASAKEYGKAKSKFEFQTWYKGKMISNLRTIGYTA